MGASTFHETAWGRNAQEAFDIAHADACHEYGHGGYTGSLAEKSHFVMIDVPAKWKGKEGEYAEHLINEGDRRIDDKWGPAGCILLESKDAVEKVPYATEVQKYNQQGTRKWETRFIVTTYTGGATRSFNSQTEAEKFAKDYVKSHNQPVKIRIEKQLVNGNQDIMVIKPKTKDVKVKGGQNKYLFFGWASY